MILYGKADYDISKHITRYVRVNLDQGILHYIAIDDWTGDIIDSYQGRILKILTIDKAEYVFEDNEWVCRGWAQKIKPKFFNRIDTIMYMPDGEDIHGLMFGNHKESTEREFLIATGVL